MLSRWVVTRLSFAIADVKPAGTVTLAARFLIADSGSQTDRAFLPVDLRHTANDTRAPLPGNDLRALPADHFGRVGDGSAARAEGHWLGFFVSHGKASNSNFLIRLEASPKSH